MLQPLECSLSFITLAFHETNDYFSWITQYPTEIWKYYKELPVLYTESFLTLLISSQLYALQWPALLAARRIQILPMNQHASWPITFGPLVDHLTALCFTASSAVRASEFVYDLSAEDKLSAPLAICSQSVSEQCGTSWCGILQSNVCFCMTFMWNMDLLESVSGNFNVNFVIKEFPADKQFTVWWINLERDS
jgi:hypothetical protein